MPTQALRSSLCVYYMIPIVSASGFCPLPCPAPPAFYPSPYSRTFPNNSKLFSPPPLDVCYPALTPPPTSSFLLRSKRPALIVVPFLSTTPTPVPFTLSWSTLQHPCTRASILLKRLPWLILMGPVSLNFIFISFYSCYHCYIISNTHFISSLPYNGPCPCPQFG